MKLCFFGSCDDIARHDDGNENQLCSAKQDGKENKKAEKLNTIPK